MCAIYTDLHFFSDSSLASTDPSQLGSFTFLIALITRKNNLKKWQEYNMSFNHIKYD